jgi:hypothetical protein
MFRFKGSLQNAGTPSQTSRPSEPLTDAKLETGVLGSRFGGLKTFAESWNDRGGPVAVHHEPTHS